MSLVGKLDLQFIDPVAAIELADVVLGRLPPASRDDAVELVLGPVNDRRAEAERRKRELDAVAHRDRRAEIVAHNAARDLASDREVEWRLGATGRLLGLEDVQRDGADRVRVWCRVCQADSIRAVDAWRPGDPKLDVPDGSLVIATDRSSATTIQAACLNGCASDAIAGAIRSAIVAATAAAENARHDDATRALLDEMSPTAAGVRPQSWCVPLLAPAHASSLLVGPSGDGKTWILILAAVCKALGIPLLGRPVERGRVLLGLLESREINEARIDLIVRGLGRTREELAGWLDVWPRGLDLRTDDITSRAELARRMRVRRWELIALDNLTKLRTSRSQSAENDSSVMSAVLEPLAALANDGTIDGERVTDDPPAILTLDHGDGGPRGSTAKLQNVDYVALLQRRSQRDPESPITISSGDGSRIVAPGLPIAIRLRGVAPDPVIAELVEREAPATDRLTPIVEAVRATPGIGINAIARAVGRSGKRELGNDLDALVEDGRLRQNDAKKFFVADEE